MKGDGLNFYELARTRQGAYVEAVNVPAGFSAKRVTTNRGIEGLSRNKNWRDIQKKEKSGCLIV